MSRIVVVALALLMCAPGAALDSNPFSDDATFSWESAPGILAFDGLPIWLYLDDRPAVRGTRLPQPPFVPPDDITAADLTTCGTEAVAAEPVDYLIPGCRPEFGPCPQWPTQEQIDWQTVHIQPIGVMLAGIGEFSWPGEFGPNFPRIFAHLRASFQSIQAAYRVGTGVQLKITKVLLLSYHYGQDHAASGAHLCETWPLLAGPDPKILLNLSFYDNGGYANQACPPDYRRMRAHYSLSMPIQSTADNYRRRDLFYLIHELTHTANSTGHSQCYWPGGAPIENCYDNPCNPTVTFEEAQASCPAWEDSSWMGYCYPRCWRKGLGPFNTPNPLGFPYLRIGPIFGPLHLVAHHNAQLLAQYRNLDVGFVLPAGAYDTPDPDADGYPAALDLCPEIEDHDQLDSDLDGVGDVCDACAIVPPARSRSAWWLLMPALLLVCWRRRTA